ncbi:MAG: alpha/beta fold hydrolase [Actinomycetaceae bacterium]|nr:alpha/beta fold hydrolase [Actinomycetaceae bacterium]
MSTILSYSIDGPTHAPALVLGSSLGSNRYMWDEIMPALGSFRVLRYDFPGHGESDILDIDRPATPADLGDSILATIADAGIDRFHIAGLSLGGMMSLWMSINRPQRIESLTMICSGPVILPSSDWTDKATAVRRNGTESLVDVTMQRWFTPEFLKRGDYRTERTRKAFIDCRDEGYAQCCEVIASMDNRPGLRRVSVPTTIIRAQYDQTLPERAAQELVATLGEGDCPAVELRTITEAAHMAAVEQPQQVAEALVASLARLRR